MAPRTAKYKILYLHIHIYTYVYKIYVYILYICMFMYLNTCLHVCVYECIFTMSALNSWFSEREGDKLTRGRNPHAASMLTHGSTVECVRGDVSVCVYARARVRVHLLLTLACASPPTLPPILSQALSLAQLPNSRLAISATQGTYIHNRLSF